MGPEATQENLIMLDVLLQASESGNLRQITDAQEDFEGDLKHVINAMVDGVNGMYIYMSNLRVVNVLFYNIFFLQRW